MNACNRHKGRWTRAAAVIFLMMGFALSSYVTASATADVMEWYVTEESVLVYVRHNGQDLSAEARVGTESAGNAVITGVDGDIPVETWLLVDNSLSISQADRSKIKQLLTDLVAGRAPGERFSLCTFSTELNVILQDSESYAELKGQIDGITHVEQSAYLTDALAEILDAEEQREGQEYVRIIVVSDGMDINPEGLTRDELTLRLRDRNIPVYTFGCKRKGNEQELKEMYALSRLTNAKNWDLTDIEDTLSVAQEMSSTELPICAAVTIPEKLRDGAPRGVQITFSDGAVAEISAAMPFGSITQETLEPEPTPQPEMPEPTTPMPLPEPGPEAFPIRKILPFLLAAVCVAAAVAGIILLLRRKKERERIKPVTDVRFTSEVTDIIGTDEGESGTVILVNNERRLMLGLTDKNNPSRHFEAPLRSKVSIGRGSSNQIVLDYERSVSGSHCEIFLDGTTFRIRDLDSSNGTYVDGIKIVGTAEISNGSTIKLGRLELVVEIR